MCMSLVRVARPVVIEVWLPDPALPTLHVPLYAGQVLRVGHYDGDEDGWWVHVAGGEGLLPEDVFDEDEGSMPAWVANGVCLN